MGNQPIQKVPFGKRVVLTTLEVAHKPDIAIDRPIYTTVCNSVDGDERPLGQTSDILQSNRHKELFTSRQSRLKIVISLQDKFFARLVRMVPWHALKPLIHMRYPQPQAGRLGLRLPRR